MDGSLTTRSFFFDYCEKRKKKKRDDDGWKREKEREKERERKVLMVDEVRGIFFSLQNFFKNHFHFFSQLNLQKKNRCWRHPY